jgi:hypothetical protein
MKSRRRREAACAANPGVVMLKVMELGGDASVGPP